MPVDEDGVIGNGVMGVLEAAKPENIRPTANVLASVMKLTRVKVRVGDDKWDADPEILVCQNGALNVLTGELGPHDRRHYATSAVPYDYDPGAEAPTWRRFLDDIFVPAIDKEGVAFLQEFAGYCLTIDTYRDVTVWMWGPRGGGRSTFIVGMETMLGDRAGSLGLREIERSRFALGEIPGKTLLTATEFPGGHAKATDILNKLISGDVMQIERKFKDPFDTKPTAKLLWAMNDLPRVSNPNDGIFRRAKVVHLPNAIPDDEKDPQVKERIKEEGAGIFNWAHEGLLRLQERGRFEVPESIRSATERWIGENDVAALFVEARCDTGDADYKTQSEELYRAYKNWAIESGYTPKNITNAAKDWERLGFRRKRHKGKSYWFGVKVAPADVMRYPDNSMGRSKLTEAEDAG